MADKSTIARPYARAAFEEAKRTGRLADWSQALQVAAAVVQDERVEDLLDNPKVTPGQLAQLIEDIAGPRLDELGRNFVQMLADNHRLAYLPEISEIFEELKDEEEGIVDVTVTSAAPLDEQQRNTLSEALARKLQRRVRLHCDIDPKLIGGAVLRAGDLVIDGSLRTRLDRIAYELTA
ncbi:MAG TPA: F0F1 ATP synthase subunit delta [Steroidobacteraceae bacterium]|jgi:F-type H+-transporting ATPase subunit delta|nr:F0F1 ATP synthase subunit delta [Steroidobacteraceae bacterium]